MSWYQSWVNHLWSSAAKSSSKYWKPVCDHLWSPSSAGSSPIIADPSWPTEDHWRNQSPRSPVVPLPNIGSISAIIFINQIISDHHWSTQIGRGPPAIITAHQRSLPILVDWIFLDLWRFFPDLLLIRGRFSTIFCESSIFSTRFNLGRPNFWIWVWFDWDQDQ